MTGARSSVAAMLIVLCAPVAAQVTIVSVPTGAERAAAIRQLRRLETKYVERLRRAHGAVKIGEQLGDALRSIDSVRLDHPSEAARDQIRAAADPFRLAIAIADDAQSAGEETTYEIDVVLTALERTTAPVERATLLAKAAGLERNDTALRLAFLERAAAVEGGSATADTADCDFDVMIRSDRSVGTQSACALAAERVFELLRAGLPREALAAFDGQPAAMQERMLSFWSAVTVEGKANTALCLVAARALAGDRPGATAMLARIAVAPWRPGAPKLEGSGHPDPSSVWRAVVERWLAPAPSATPADEGFPLLAEFIATDVFGLGHEVQGVGFTVYAELAAREGYPALANYGWRLTAAYARSGQDAPQPLPGDVAAASDRLRAALAEREKSADVASAAARRDLPDVPAIKCLIDCERLDLARDVQILALDHSGEHGVAILERQPFFGLLFRIERRDGGLVAVREDSWQS
jgi:hypothetical protein